MREKNYISVVETFVYRDKCILVKLEPQAIQDFEQLQSKLPDLLDNRGIVPSQNDLQYPVDLSPIED